MNFYIVVNNSTGRQISDEYCYYIEVRKSKSRYGAMQYHNITQRFVLVVFEHV